MDGIKIVVPDWIVEKYHLQEGNKLKVSVDYNLKQIKILGVIKCQKNN